MTITVELQPDIERCLSAQAHLHALSLQDYVQQIVAREAHVVEPPAARRTGQELIDICAQVRGLLTDDEIDVLFRRNPSTARPVDLS